MKRLLFLTFTFLGITSTYNAQFTFQKLHYSTTSISFVSDAPSGIFNSKILQTTDDGYLVSGRLDNLFGAEKTVLFTPNSIACSTGDASTWHENFQKCLDPSGDAIQTAFA